MLAGEGGGGAQTWRLYTAVALICIIIEVFANRYDYNTQCI